MNHSANRLTENSESKFNSPHHIQFFSPYFYLIDNRSNLRISGRMLNTKLTRILILNNF
jgi:hypothetical protein